MRISNCTKCGCPVETAVLIRNLVCLTCLGAAYARAAFDDDTPTTPRAIAPMLPENPR